MLEEGVHVWEIEFSIEGCERGCVVDSKGFADGTVDGALYDKTVSGIVSPGFNGVGGDGNESFTDC